MQLDTHIFCAMPAFAELLRLGHNEIESGDLSRAWPQVSGLRNGTQLLIPAGGRHRGGSLGILYARAFRWLRVVSCKILAGRLHPQRHSFSGRIGATYYAGASAAEIGHLHPALGRGRPKIAAAARNPADAAQEATCPNGACPVEPVFSEYRRQLRSARFRLNSNLIIAPLLL